VRRLSYSDFRILFVSFKTRKEVLRLMALCVTHFPLCLRNFRIFVSMGAGVFRSRLDRRVSFNRPPRREFVFRFHSSSPVRISKLLICCEMQWGCSGLRFRSPERQYLTSGPHSDPPVGSLPSLQVESFFIPVPLS